MELDGTLLYRQVVDATSRAPENVIVEQAVRGPRRALFFSWWTKTWRFDPLNVQLMLVEDVETGSDRVQLVDRSTAEAAARAFGQELPEETVLRQLLDDGASAMYAEDDRVKPLPWE